jgi:parallel beta-helix repeat protein
MIKRTSTLLTLSLLTIAENFAATYFVDYAEGDNNADGLSAGSAWKQSPGDTRANGNPATVELQPDDIVRFRGGVRYFGEIELDVAGEAGKPIVLDGNADGRYGEGRAILDGAAMITDWQSVDSAEMVGGNQKWKDILYADLDVDLSSNFSQDSFVLHRDKKQNKQAPWQRIFLIDGDRSVLPIAQIPKPSNSFYPDLPEDFYKTSDRIGSSYPHQIGFEEGSRGNSTTPLISITYGGDNAPVVQPLDGGTIYIDMNEAKTIAEVGYTLFRPTSMPAPEQIVFAADGREIYTADIDPDATSMQRFQLPKSVKAKRITFQLKHSDPPVVWTKLQQIAVFSPDGDNVIQSEIASYIDDAERLGQQEDDWFDDMFIGVRGGNNHVYFSKILDYNPVKKRLNVPHFTSRIYDQTQYALYNSPKLISLPGEWCLAPLPDGKTRVFFLPEHAERGQPANIGYPELKSAISLQANSSHVDVNGFLIQRYSGGNGGIATFGNGSSRANNIRISNCEIRFSSVNAGISLNHSDDITVENCYIHHCPGWTVGIYVNRIKDYRIKGNRIDNNSGSGIRHYESKDGHLTENYVLEHYGMHSSGLNFYEGCADILFENNYVENIIAINRSAHNLIFRNNVINSENRSAASIAMWSSGRTGDKQIRNLTFENNTFVNTDKSQNWSTSIFVQGGAPSPEGLVIRNNVIDRLRSPNPSEIDNNIFMIESDPSVMGTNNQLVEDPNVLFIDPANGDYRRKPGGPMMNAGADVPPLILTQQSK